MPNPDKPEGPWDVYGHMITTKPNGEGDAVAVVMCQNYETQRRRAHLLAAAPEMLAALERCGETLDFIRDHLGIVGPGDDGDRKGDRSDIHGILGALDETRDAINKAKGLPS